jgi:hypothetical protein
MLLLSGLSDSRLYQFEIIYFSVQIFNYWYQRECNLLPLNEISEFAPSISILLLAEEYLLHHTISPQPTRA